jgi:transposase
VSFRLSVREFEDRFKSEKDVRAKTRLHILFLRRRNQTQQNISELLGVSQGTVSNVCNRFLERGFDSVYNRPRSGRPSQLTRKQKELLKKEMSKEVIDGENRRGWQTKDVRSLLKKRFDQTFTVQHTRRIMHNLGMSWKVPRPMHINRDEKAVARFKKNSNEKSFLWQMNTK